MEPTVWYLTIVLWINGVPQSLNNFTQEYPSKDDCNRASKFYNDYYKKTDLKVEGNTCINSNFYSRPLSNGTFIKTIRSN